ncbi:MAG TPA: hypothetical protein VNV44_05015 [Solirubrobacteraceae bacterium]|jgi:hypothetical protein|nr:hypothetical protein [Solirubrobacteraceae bacterium]
MRRNGNRRAGALAGVLGALGLALAAAAGAGGASAARLAPSGLAYSTAPAATIQRQPPADSCHAKGTGLTQLPDRRCTPGAVNPAVTQSTIAGTICRSGWTATVRPPESVTEPEKLASLRAYGESGPSRYEYDHLVPLELGGAVNDPRNLWPEPDYARREGFYLNPKDRVETKLKQLVCSGQTTLATAQRQIAADWVAALARYG